MRKSAEKDSKVVNFGKIDKVNEKNTKTADTGKETDSTRRKKSGAGRAETTRRKAGKAKSENSSKSESTQTVEIVKSDNKTKAKPGRPKKDRMTQKTVVASTRQEKASNAGIPTKADDKPESASKAENEQKTSDAEKPKRRRPGRPKKSEATKVAEKSAPKTEDKKTTIKKTEEPKDVSKKETAQKTATKKVEVKKTSDAEKPKRRRPGRPKKSETAKVAEKSASKAEEKKTPAKRTQEIKDVAKKESSQEPAKNAETKTDVSPKTDKAKQTSSDVKTEDRKQSFSASELPKPQLKIEQSEGKKAPESLPDSEKAPVKRRRPGRPKKSEAAQVAKQSSKDVDVKTSDMPKTELTTEVKQSASNQTPTPAELPKARLKIEQSEGKKAPESLPDSEKAPVKRRRPGRPKKSEAAQVAKQASKDVDVKITEMPKSSEKTDEKAPDNNQNRNKAQETKKSENERRSNRRPGRPKKSEAAQAAKQASKDVDVKITEMPKSSEKTDEKASDKPADTRKNQESKQRGRRRDNTRNKKRNDNRPAEPAEQVAKNKNDDSKKQVAPGTGYKKPDDEIIIRLWEGKDEREKTVPAGARGKLPKIFNDMAGNRLPDSLRLTAEQKLNPAVVKVLDSVDKFLSREVFIDNTVSVLAAVSGGVDSIVMLDALAQLSEKYYFDIAGAHFNHTLRGADSLRDEEFVKNLFEDYGFEFNTASGDVKQYAQKNKVSVETAARTLRYNFLERTSRTNNNDFVATGHTADDSAETFLMNLFRGTGLTGLCGIPRKRNFVKNVVLIRPIMSLSKKDIIEYAKIRGLKWREDHTNSTEEYTRNIVRNKLIPLIEKEFNPSAVDAINRAAKLINGAEENITGQIESALPDLLTDIRTERFSIKSNILQTFDTFMQGELLSHAIIKHLRIGGLEMKKIEAILGLIGKTGKEVEFYPGMKAVYDRNLLILGNFEGGVTGSAEVVYNEFIDIDKYKLMFTRIDRRKVKFNRNPKIEYFDEEALPDNLIVRPWKQGDSFSPLGMDGSMKVSDFLINQKVAGVDKPNILVIAEKDSDEIVWVCGYRINEKFKVTDKTRKAVKVEYYTL